MLRQQPQLDSVTILYSGGYNATLTFYKFTYKHQQQKELTIFPGTAIRALKPGMVTLLCNAEYRARLDSVFQVMELHQDQPCQTLLLLSHK
ncbi:hypothetical protein N008_07430 [Hymenobacter sp. APR13]|nr:hypothetical protein N008_07430 [Hymenobacter sp. APR13]